MRPLVISVAYLSGVELSVTGIFLGFGFLDWINWPLSMMPNFLKEVDTMIRKLKRVQ
jgi:hypothetical protein